MPRPCPTAGQERTKSRGEAKAWAVDLRWQSGHVADTWKTQGGEKADGRHMPDTWQLKVLQGGTQGRHMAETRRTYGRRSWRRSQPNLGSSGQGLETRAESMADTMAHNGGHTAGNGGHMADKLRDAARAYFLLRENPAVNRLGKYTVWGTTQGGQVADTRRTSGGQGPEAQGGQVADKWRTRAMEALPKPNRRRTQGGQAADKDWRRGQSQQHKADTRRTSGEQAANTRRTSGGQGPEARPKLTTQGGHKADTRRTSGRRGRKARPKTTTQGGQVADKWRTQADTWRTSSGDAARAYCGQPFFS